MYFVSLFDVICDELFCSIVLVLVSILKQEHNIIPKTIIKDIKDTIRNTEEVIDNKKATDKLSKKEKERIIDELTHEMKRAAKELDFERATELRDIIFEMQSE